MAADLTTGENTLDASAVRALAELLGNDQQALAEIVDALLDEAPQRLGELSEGASAGDAALVARAAHTLKANAAMFGAGPLEGLCRDLEVAARGGDLSGAAQPIAAIGAEWLAVRPQLLALRERGAAQ
jgi:HPt (histidine-containing phosphotransfer) domain-containing protein